MAWEYRVTVSYTDFTGQPANVCTLDGVDHTVITADDIAAHTQGVLHANARARWTGRTLRVEVEGWGQGHHHRRRGRWVLIGSTTCSSRNMAATGLIDGRYRRRRLGVKR